MFDDIGNEAFLMFDFHGIEGSPAGINTDEKLMFRLKLLQFFRGIHI